MSLKEKILITGCSGYIGLCLMKYLIKKKKYDVFGLDKKKNNTKNNFFFKGNINDKTFLNNVLMHVKPNLIIHLAGESTIDGIKNNWICLNKNNISYSKKIV